MVCHILCPECGEDLAEIYPAYEATKNKYFENIMKEHGNIDIDKIDFKADILPALDFIFKALRINNHCCRIHILGVTDFDF